MQSFAEFLKLGNLGLFEVTENKQHLTVFLNIRSFRRDEIMWKLKGNYVFL